MRCNGHRWQLNLLSHNSNPLGYIFNCTLISYNHLINNYKCQECNSVITMDYAYVVHQNILRVYQDLAHSRYPINTTHGWLDGTVKL